ncbi:hypothetical protein HS125_15085 [bacterium]|nr:hypothetical protein [bacterium]
MTERVRDGLKRAAQTPSLVLSPSASETKYAVATVMVTLAVALLSA